MFNHGLAWIQNQCDTLSFITDSTHSPSLALTTRVHIYPTARDIGGLQCNEVGASHCRLSLHWVHDKLAIYSCLSHPRLVNVRLLLVRLYGVCMCEFDALVNYMCVFHKTSKRGAFVVDHPPLMGLPKKGRVDGGINVRISQNTYSYIRTTFHTGIYGTGHVVVAVDLPVDSIAVFGASKCGVQLTFADPFRWRRSLAT